MLECHACQKQMCEACCVGFQKNRDETKFIRRGFWKNDPIYSTISRRNSHLHLITDEEVKLPFCENWEDVRIYNDADWVDSNIDNENSSEDESNVNHASLYGKLTVFDSHSKSDMNQRSPQALFNKKKRNWKLITEEHKGPINVKDTTALDGGLLFPSYHLIIPGYIGMPQTNVLGKQNYHGEEGIPHAVIDGNMGKTINMHAFSTHKKKIMIKRTTFDEITLPDIYGNLMIKKFNGLSWEWI